MNETTQTAAAIAEAADPGILTVVLTGLGAVFAGLLIIMFLCSVISRISTARQKKSPPPEKTSEETKPDGELAAVIGAAIAEDLGTDVSGIRIISVKKVGK